jgi:ectoine hydroxylase-related dioxygenase (phytanoyl-CoA dioxygenase family)
MAAAATAAGVDFYRREGYWVSPPLLSSGELETLRHHAMQVIHGHYETRRPPMNRNPSHPEDPTAPPPQTAADANLSEDGGLGAAALHQVNNAYWADATIARMVTDARVGQLAAELAGVAGVRLWHDQLLYKPASQATQHQNRAAETSTVHPKQTAAQLEERPGDGSVGFHQDYGYWQCLSDERCLTARLALYDEDETTGCMQVLAGSHRWTSVHPSPEQPEQRSKFLAGRNVFTPPNPDIEEQFRQMAARSGRAPRALMASLRPLRVRAGALTFHHSRTVHGSWPNPSSHAARCTLVIHMIVDGTTFRGWAAPCAQHSSNILLQPADGEAYAGPYFPVLWREEGAANGSANVWSAAKL